MAKYHIDRTLPETPAIFVFGSNDDGAHGAGAALVAKRKFGARTGVGEGLTGASYGIPTVGRRLSRKTFEQIAPPINRFVKYVKDTPHLNFFITRVGCQLAGFKDSDVAPLFKDLVELDNVSFPETWKHFLEN